MAFAASLGPYRVLEPLGEGGMGVVYRARHTVTERVVAIKTVRLLTPRWIESIRREIDALTRVRHPGIVRILDHGIQDGRPWYAMDLLEGESLRDFGVRIWSPFRTRSAPPGPPPPVTATEPVSQHRDGNVERSSLPPASSTLRVGHAPAAAGALPQVVALMRRLCATLAFLHGEGFVSCDLKPENVVLVGSTPVLIDFGLTTRFPASSGREAIDVQGSMAGTLPYMSPEQLRGELLDARSDLYAVGCILYELVTGGPPFSGSPFSIRGQHLTAAPTPPSGIVRDVPPALEALVLRLLLKQPNDRVGFADEVAAALGEITGDAQRLHDFPPARPYLYRPRFVGRADTLATLTDLRDAACAGRGAMAVIGGESGVGKTRLGLELTRVSPGSGLRVIASESVAVAPEQGGAIASSPLHAVRPLLRAIADCCQEGGEETIERLLGGRRSVLALYEPLLADVPAAEPLAPIVPLAPDASRQRLLRYVAQSLTAFAQEQPLLWVLDDLGWADDLSLAFLGSLTLEYFAATPALLVGTYRSEEATDAVRALAGQAHVIHLSLPRLRVDDVSAMVADMLAVPTQETGFAAYVADAAEGNPFFVTEHVRTAVSERLFYRDQNHAWRMRIDGDRAGYEGLPLPRSLGDLIDHRLRALSDLAQQAARTAAVLGRESALDVVTEVAGLSSEAAAAAIDELIRRQVLEQSNPEKLRFVHDKVREVAYAGAAATTLRAIHARAAVALERRWQDRPDAAEGWATLGHHFAAGSLPEPAARYLTRAADHARATFANADAIVLYRRAISQVHDVIAQLQSDANTWRTSLIELHEALGDVLALGASREQARAAYADALRDVDTGDAVPLARLQRKTGNTWEGEGEHALALGFYVRARQALPSVLASAALGARDEWIMARFDELRVYYWLARSHEMDALVGELRPVVEKHGTAQQLAGFYQSQIFHRLGRDRYTVSDDTLALSEIVLRVCGATGAPDRAWAYFQRGFTLLLSRGANEAEPDLTVALQLADRAGDVVNQARSALYLAVAARMRGSVDEVPARSARAARIASDACMRQYIAAAKATDAWICVRRGDLDGALKLTEDALSDWAAYGGVFPFHWLALAPRLEAQLARGLIAGATESCRALLVPDQRRLPPAVEEALGAAIASWNAGDEPKTRRLLDAAVRTLADHSLQ